MSQAQPQPPAGTAQPAARCPGRTEHDEEQGSCPGFTSTRFAPERFAAGRVELVWVRKCLLRALRACGGLWGAEPLLRGRIPRHCVPSESLSSVTQSVRQILEHLQPDSPGIVFLHSLLFTASVKKNVFPSALLSSRSSFLPHTPRTSTRAPAGRTGLSRQLKDVGDTVVVPSKGQSGISPSAPPRPESGPGRGALGNQLPEHRVLPNVTYRRAELRQHFPEPPPAQPVLVAPLWIKEHPRCHPSNSCSSAGFESCLMVEGSSFCASEFILLLSINGKVPCQSWELITIVWE